MDGDRLFVAAREGGVHIFDISEPLNPKPLSSYDTPGEANGLSLAGDYLYVTDGSQPLRVLRVGCGGAAP